MRVMALQSGSNGNSVYVEAAGVRLLVDAGISGVQMQRRLAAGGIDAHEIDGLLISHDHSDHVRCMGIYYRKYGIPVYVTENGACFDDEPDENGFVNDTNRTEYLQEHLGAVLAAMQEGVDVRGYLVWSLMDNFEWSHGYAKRFGLVRCDFESLERTVKASGRWYANLISTGQLEAAETAARNDPCF